MPGEGEAVRPFPRGYIEMVRGWIWGPRWIAFHVERVFDNVIGYRCPGCPSGSLFVFPGNSFHVSS